MEEDCKWEGRRQKIGVTRIVSNTLIHLALSLTVIANLHLIIDYCNKWVPLKEVSWSKNIILKKRKSLLYFVKLGMILQSENNPPVIWKFREGGNCKEIGSDLQDQIIFSSKQVWEGIGLDCWMNEREKSGI